MSEELTKAGRAYAERNQEESMVARVALYGRETGWPDHFIATSVKTCNEAADPEDD